MARERSSLPASSLQNGEALAKGGNSTGAIMDRTDWFTRGVYLSTSNRPRRGSSRLIFFSLVLLEHIIFQEGYFDAPDEPTVKKIKPFSEEKKLQCRIIGGKISSGINKQYSFFIYSQINRKKIVYRSCRIQEESLVIIIFLFRVISISSN